MFNQIEIISLKRCKVWQQRDELCMSSVKDDVERTKILVFTEKGTSGSNASQNWTRGGTDGDSFLMSDLFLV